MKNQPISKQNRKHTEEFIADLKIDGRRAAAESFEGEPGQEWFAIRMVEEQIALAERSLTWEPPADE